MTRISILCVCAVLGSASLMARPPELPSFFARNDGQAPPEARFVLRRAGGAALFLDRGVALQVAGARVESRFLGTEPGARVEGRALSQATANYFEGRDDRSWHTGVPLYGEVAYKGLWAGIDAVYSTTSLSFKSEFRVAAGGNPSSIGWRYMGAARAALEMDGSLTVRAGGQTVKEDAPEIYQEKGGKRVHIAGGYRVEASGAVGFWVGPYDRSRELVIDPVIVFATLMGGSNQDNATSVAADANGNMVVAGWTSSTNFPVTGASRQPRSGGSVDAFIAKFNGTGSSLLFCTFLGGNGDDRAFGVALDAAGNIYVAGRTGSSNFPVFSALQPRINGSQDAFIAKLNPSGSQLLFSTYMGGTDVDAANAIVVDASGYVYVAGDTSSTNFPVSGSFKASNQGGQDAFVAKLTPAGTAVVYSTYLGGKANDHATALAVNAAGNAFVVGSTYSPDFPVNFPVQATSGGNEDAFVTELAVGGNSLIFSTYLGGSSGTPGLPEEADAVALDGAGNVYVGGTTSSLNFPVTGSALQATFSGGNQDAFLVQYGPFGQGLRYASYLGGSGLEYITGIAVDAFGYVTAVGYTSSVDFPVLRAVQKQNNGSYDAFAAKFLFSGAACSLINSTYLGGTASDAATSVALDADGSALIAGYTASYDFPVAAAKGKAVLQGSNYGLTNAFAWKLANPFTRAVAQMTAAGPAFALDTAGDRLWDSASYSGLYTVFGNPGDIPIVGDWNHSGSIKVGVFRNGLWILDSNGNGAIDASDRQFMFGQAGDIPVLGDWDGTGTLKAGLYRGGTWILDYSGHLQGTSTGQTDKTYSFGSAADTPITGDWTGTGATKIGVFRAGFWILDTNGDGALTAADAWYQFGQAGDTPVTGDWDGSGVTHPGIVRNGAWYLNYRWNNEPGLLGSAGTERRILFGGPGAIPMAARNFN